LTAAERWACVVIFVCFAWPALLAFARETVVALAMLGAALGIARGTGLFLAAYAVVAYPLLRSVRRSLQVPLGITVAAVLPVCLGAMLSGIYPPTLRPTPGWLLRVAASAAALYATARWLRGRHLRYVVAAFVILTTAISWRHYYRGDWIGDLYMFRQALWTTLHGCGFFWVSDEGGSHFGVHNSPILFLFLPLYAIWDSGALLLLLQSIAVALSAYPMYALARDRLAEPAAMVLTLGFLLLTSVIGPTLSWFKELPFALPLFLAALVAFERGRLKSFAAWGAALLMVRETLAATLAVFALYAACRRRLWPWIALPLAMGLGWGALSSLVITPQFFVPGKSNRHFLALYHGLGSSMPEVLATYVRHPDLAADRLHSLDNRGYVEKITRPFGRFIPLGSVAIVFAAPDLMTVGLSRYRGSLIYELPASYHLITVSAFTVAFLFTLAGLTRRFRLGPAPLHLALGLFFITSVTDSLPVVWRPPKSNILPRAEVRARQEIADLVPQDASVSATYSMVTQLAHRREIYLLLPFVSEIEQVRQVSPDYVATAGGVGNPTPMDALRAEGYELVASRPPFALYRKSGAPSPESGRPHDIPPARDTHPRE
jgi:uncharacterized membrane protein